MASQEVSWWSVHEFLTELVAQATGLPFAGTPSWCALADDDPAKLLALAVAGEHHVLRVETAQIALAEASHDVSTHARWITEHERFLKQRNGIYIPRQREGAA